MARSRSDSPPLFNMPDKPDFKLERRLMADGNLPVAGVDEAGRGPLAGPVVAAAVILDPRRIPRGLDDSKRLDRATREKLFATIMERAVAVSFSCLSATSIDERNILRASLEAMRRAVAGLCVTPAWVLADGRDVPPGLPCQASAIVKGDRRSQSIAAASIVAKVVRDRVMTRCGAIHAAYGFESHMGYATETHRVAIQVSGAVPRLHRLTFSPFRLADEGGVQSELLDEFA